MMATYGGDEVSALVLDIGSTNTRAGYAGEDSPKAVLPSAVGIVPKDESSGTSIKSKNHYVKPYIGETVINTWREDMELRYPLKNGMVEDWAAYEALWDYAFSQRLRQNTSEHPLLLTECAWNPREKREKITELAFEKFDVPAFYLAKSATLAAFASGRPTALVLESGGSMTSAVPVVDGYVLKRGIVKQALAGEFLSDQAILLLNQERNINIVPQYLIAKKEPVDPEAPAKVTLKELTGVTKSFHQHAMRRTAHEWKETVAQTLEYPNFEQAVISKPAKSFEFPDGFNTSIGAERFKIPEIMFNPQKYIQDNGSVSTTTATTPSTTSEANPEFQPVQYLIQNSITSCDVDMRTSLYSNIVLTGGNTLFSGFADRLNYEMGVLAPGVRIKLYAPGNSADRKFGSWIGGSILASLGTFHQQWISKKEYEESGSSIVEKRCQ